MLAVLVATCTTACSSRGRSADEAAPAARTFALGFAPTPPVLTVEAVLEGIDLWSQRAEFAVIHEELPWTDLLAGMTPQQILERDKTALVAHLRSKGLKLMFLADLTDGLSRSDEAPQLRALGRSLAEPAVQQVARAYVLAVDALLAPELLGLSAETNLVRAAAPAGLYAAVVATANAMAQDLAAAGSTATRFISVQVETAWGLLPPGPFAGIDQDLADFAFVAALGLSSYPYFAFDDPDQVPDDYYLRLALAVRLPVFVSEGGWTSATVGGRPSSPAVQARWIERHAALLASVDAFAWFHLLFADPDLSAWPQPLPPNLPLFTNIGLCDSDFTAKPALAAWDALFARPLAP
ncbi:MAG: hypothetical protein JNL08_10690 [Planctomycetes bacterium]|nr:hypothetical protein [Planctomycetota bacterium]